MGKIVAIDYGAKRTGIAETDSLQLIASGLTTVSTYDLKEFMLDYLSKEEVDCLVVGEPKDLKNQNSEIEKSIVPFINFIKKRFKDLEIVRVDERFTSKMAFQSMIDGGLKKKQRQDKGMIDKVSATIILQTYLESKSHL
ncbi:MAG: Holliday junction resolvase RuvX [Bacteroidetes bacterium]|nr:MAG: Holliday junction resolvase RuvX [Bacteroidota bacterium]MBL1144445.1 Holliday junction resolvase RuvX [Bacteroidota bacterium]MCB0803629.1 Holliday junction resolvase RuvX [Flavobacteriales bacterium]NOG57240.1 Holliday junction resolvase RuvX [Bacteroidota bacterium]